MTHYQALLMEDRYWSKYVASEKRVDRLRWIISTFLLIRDINLSGPVMLARIALND